MRTRNIHTIRADVMLHETGYYLPTAREAYFGFGGTDRRVERQLHLGAIERRAA